MNSDCEEDVKYGTVLEKYSIKTDKPSKVLSVGEVSIFQPTYDVLLLIQKQAVKAQTSLYKCAVLAVFYASMEVDEGSDQNLDL